MVRGDINLVNQMYLVESAVYAGRARKLFHFREALYQLIEPAGVGRSFTACSKNCGDAW